MKSTTNIYDRKSNRVITEKLITLAEYIQFGRLKSGQLIFLGDVILDCQNQELHTNTERFFVGDATPYHAPSENDGGFSWNYQSQICRKYVLEVHDYNL